MTIRSYSKDAAAFWRTLELRLSLKQATPREVTSFFASIDLTWSSSIFPSGITVGAMAYVVKDAAPEELVKAIQEVQRGNHYLGHRLAIDVATSRTPSRPHLLADLTLRELDALILLAEGKSYSYIAQKLGISYKTVVNISWQLKKKLEADNLQALVRKAARLLGPTDRP